MISLRVSTRNFRFAEKPIYIKTLTESHREFLNRSGGFVRKVAERSMRRGKISKRNGKKLHAPANVAPRYWGDAKLRRSIAFRITPDNRSVYIQPTRWPGSKVPDILETGGRSYYEEFDEASRRWVKRPVNVKPHPYMNPAREKLQPTMRKIWEDSFRLKRRGRF